MWILHILTALYILLKECYAGEYCTDLSLSFNLAYYCEGYCCGAFDSECCTLTTGVIVGIVFACIGALIIAAVVLICYCQKTKGSRGTILRTNQNRTTVFANNATGGPPPYSTHAQGPPPYQGAPAYGYTGPGPGPTTGPNSAFQPSPNPSYPPPAYSSFYPTPGPPGTVPDPTGPPIGPPPAFPPSVTQATAPDLPPRY